MTPYSVVCPKCGSGVNEACENMRFSAAREPKFADRRWFRRQATFYPHREREETARVARLSS